MTERGEGIDSRFYEDIIDIVRRARHTAGRTVNLLQVVSNWLIGRRIVEEEQNGAEKAGYAEYIVRSVSEALTEEFGAGFSVTNIKNYRKFYLMFSNLSIGQTLSDQLEIADKLPESPQGLKRGIGQTLSDQFSIPLPDNLSWSHFERLMRVDDENARLWYMREASAEQWDFRTLKRNIDSQYYYRLMQTPENKRCDVASEMQRNTAEFQNHKLEYLKNPVLTEFLGIENNAVRTESYLENAIIQHLEKFLLELGKGYAFVARQKHIKTDAGDYYIDLVFYNYILKCFLLIDLKSVQITHQDIGQMDMYVRMYDELVRSEDDNPTIGLLLCAETSRDLARFSILKGNEQIFAAKYLTYLPTEEQLRKEIEEQKAIFALQNAQAEEKQDSETVTEKMNGLGL